MALTWDATKVENFKEKNEKHGKWLECFIWAALSIGMNEIKESNVKEWVYRLNRMKFEGHALFVVAVKGEKGVEPKELDITEDDVREWIGLKTNVEQISAAAFDKRVRQLTGREARK